MQRTPREALSAAVDIAGGQTALARAIGVGQGHVWNWLNLEGRRVPPESCIPIERATGGAVTRYELRPDVFGESPDPVTDRAPDFVTAPKTRRRNRIEVVQIEGDVPTPLDGVVEILRQDAHLLPKPRKRA